jgi:hypothetical protein
VRRDLRAACTLLALGGTVGVLFDQIHVSTGTTVYSAPVVLGQPLWVSPLFGAAGLGFGMGRVWLDPKASRPSEREVGVSFALFVLAYVLSTMLSGLVAVGVLGGLAVATFLACERSARGAVLALVSAAAGTGVEIALVAMGTFRYREGDLFGVAVWLPALYLSAAMAVGALGRKLASEPRDQSSE